MTLRVGVIGTRNHAARMLRLALSQPDVGSATVFHPDRERLAMANIATSDTVKTTTDLDELISADAVIVCSPSDTHAAYVARLLDGDAFILCEKPLAVNHEELTWYRSLASAARRRIFCNLNYVYTDLALHAQKAVATGRLGKAIHAQFTATHGLAFRESFAENWRLQQQDVFSTIVGNLGIHYIDLFAALFGSVQDCQVQRAAWSPKTQGADSCLMTATTVDGGSASIYLSYATSYCNSARVMFTDGALVLDDGCVFEYAPRDHVDADGRFATPQARQLSRSESSKAYYDTSIERALGVFLDRARRGEGADDADFQRALTSAELILRAHCSANAHELAARS